jgi:hypothetical protein
MLHRLFVSANTNSSAAAEADVPLFVEHCEAVAAEIHGDLENGGIQFMALPIPSQRPTLWATSRVGSVRCSSLSPARQLEV